MDVTPSGDVAVVANVASGLVGGIDLVSAMSPAVQPAGSAGVGAAAVTGAAVVSDAVWACA